MMWAMLATMSVAASVAPTAGPSDPVTVFEPSLGGGTCWRIPSLLALSPTKLLALAGSRCMAGDGCAPLHSNGSALHAMVGLRRSLDGGKSWLPLQVLYSVPCVGHYPGSVILQPNAVYDPFTKKVNVGFMTEDHGHLMVLSSADDGESFAQVAPLIPVSSSDDTAPGNGVVLSPSGKIILLGQSRELGAYFVASTDGGATFGVPTFTGIEAKNQLNEPQLVELGGNVLFVKGHTGDFTPGGGLVDATAVSRDNGTTWQQQAIATPFNLTTCQGGLAGTRPMWMTTVPASLTPSSSSPSSAVSNTMFFSHPNVPAAKMSSGGGANRYNGSIWRSTDGGVHWEVVMSLTEDHLSPSAMFAYSAMTPLDTPSAAVEAAGPQLVLPMGVLYETGSAELCGDDPRYGTPSQSCIVVFKAVELPLGTLG